MQTISNAYLSVDIDEKGGCISKITYMPDREVLTFPGADYWKYSDHILFPFCGRMNGGYYEYCGKCYKSDLHGFAKDSAFSVVEKEEKRVKLAFSQNKQTLAVYPFEFSFAVTYELKEKTLSVAYEVENTGDKTMYFMLGAHPGFLLDADQTDEADLHSEDNEYLPLDGVLLSREIRVEKDGVIKLDKRFFRKHNTFIAKRKSDTLTIKRKNFDIDIKSDSPLIALWADDMRDQYVCAESWWGACDYAKDPVRELGEKSYINMLEAGKSKKFGYSVWVKAKQEI